MLTLQSLGAGMKNFKLNGVIFILFLLTSSIIAQTNFSVDAYKMFLEQNQNLDSKALLDMHSAGLFNENGTSGETSLYRDSVEIKYGLTDDEKSLLNKHGFVVTERNSRTLFANSFAEIYHKDLPVFVSTDAILNAFHQSYDKILISVETGYLIPKLEHIINSMHQRIGELENLYSSDTTMLKSLMDVDLYLSVPLYFLKNSHLPYFSSNVSALNTMLGFINSQNVLDVKLFSSTARTIDFSQFTPRGHYTGNETLENYFKAMIWLGKTEIYLSAPQTIDPPDSVDVHRQVIDAFLISELFDLSGIEVEYNNFEKIIKSFIGKQDNVTIENLTSLKSELNISSPSELKEKSTYNLYSNLLAEKPYANQQILSQILFSDPFLPEKIKPASAFLLFGQRFIVDSYVTGSVVFDKITYNNQKVLRLFPNTLDVLFAIGNDAAGQLLNNELEKYHYSPNLASLRYLIDSYDDDFWNSSIYNMWLSTIRTLNPPEDRTTLPSFMQTAAWWQQKMNTQLASWSELRHDNLLYAKQSYTGAIPICSYPYSYVEPNPDFYLSLINSCNQMIKTFNSVSFLDGVQQERIINHFEYCKTIYDTLYTVSHKELNQIPLDANEIYFLETMYSEIPGGCSTDPSGWYLNLIYKETWETSNIYGDDYLIVNYHTIPTDEFGNMMGWVKHAGTGNVDLAIVNARHPSGKEITFVGPVYSYHEYTTTNFDRLTDEEWRDEFLNASTRPEWTNIYLTDQNGNSKGNAPSLLTNIQATPNEEQIPNNYIIAKNYPNPFNPATTISFTIPQSLTNSRVNLVIYNLHGEKIVELVNTDLPSGNYLTRWNGKNSFGQIVTSGIYFYRIIAGDQHFAGKMNLLK